MDIEAIIDEEVNIEDLKVSLPHVYVVVIGDQLGSWIGFGYRYRMPEWLERSRRIESDKQK